MVVVTSNDRHHQSEPEPEPEPEPDHGTGTGQNGAPGSRRAARVAAKAMPAEHAVLGLIAEVGGDAHGYELARHFDPDRPLGQVLRLEQSMLYQHLKKLESRGWLTMSLQPQGSRPPRQVYGITAEGRAELRRWLEEPVAHTREIRLEFLVKLFFAIQLDPDRARRLVAEQQAVCEQLAASLTMQIAELEDQERDQTDRDDAPTVGRDFPRMVLELRLAQTQAAAVWLDGVAAWCAGPIDRPRR